MNPTNSPLPNSNPIPNSVPPTNPNNPTLPTPINATSISPTTPTQPTNIDSISSAPVEEPSGTLQNSKENASINPAPNPNTTKKKDKITLVSLIIIFLLILCAALGVLIFQLINDGRSSGEPLSSNNATIINDINEPNTNSSNSDTNPNSPNNNSNATEENHSQHHTTLKLAKSVCEKYGGEFTATSGSDFYFYGAEPYYCIGTEGPGIVLSNGSQLIIGFIEDGKKNEVWSKIKSAINDSEGHEDVSKYIILEDSDTFIKAYSTIAGLAREYIVAYDNVVVDITAGSDHVIEETLTELGFPNGKRAADYK